METKSPKPNRNDWNSFEPQFQGFQVFYKIKIRKLNSINN